MIDGHENDEYSTEIKEIDGYNLVEIPQNSKGTMIITENPDGTYDAEIEVVYYYKKIAGGVIEDVYKRQVNDILGSVKADLTAYQTAISESENMNLRQTFQQIRNSDESFQYELFKIAQTKGYYKPAQKATVTEINQVKTDLQQ